ncbi:MAG TPA: GNAT family N-acetyltransferase [Polyangiaceae bacterium]
MPPADASTEITFRYATETDTAQVIALVESAYRGDASRRGWTTEADLLDGQRTDAEEVASILADAHARLMLAIKHQQIVGCVVVKSEPNGAYIGMLAVSPTRQAAGTGRLLLTEAEARARLEFGATHVRMTVIEQRQELIGWYERRGYRMTEKTEPFPYGNPRFGLPKRDDLRFVVMEKAV